MSLLATFWEISLMASVIWVIYDTLTRNKSLTDIMKIMWIVVTLIFGVMGAVFYYLIGRSRY
ncbi:MAG: PLDc N-terminal domain-containing protein [Methanosarcina sp.]